MIGKALKNNSVGTAQFSMHLETARSWQRILVLLRFGHEIPPIFLATLAHLLCVLLNGRARARTGGPGERVIH